MVGLIDSASKKEIEKAIEEAELLTSGEVRVHIKAECNEDVYLEAEKVFQKLNIHRTKDRNGILIFIGLKTRRFAVLGDIGIHEKVGDAFWTEVRDIMENDFKKGNLKEGIINGVMTVGMKLKEYFPRSNDDINELPNTVSID